MPSPKQAVGTPVADAQQQRSAVQLLHGRMGMSGETEEDRRPEGPARRKTCKLCDPAEMTCTPGQAAEKLRDGPRQLWALADPSHLHSVTFHFSSFVASVSTLPA